MSALLVSVPAFAGVKPIAVDCVKGESIQAAIDKNPSPVIVDIHGICAQSVVVLGKDVTLRGTNAATDGISGTGVTVPATQYGLVEFRNANVANVENLSITNSPTRGIASYFTNLTLLRCRITNNASYGMHLSASSFVDGTELTLSDNAARGVRVQRNAIFSCHGCVFQNNAGAAESATGALVTLLNPTINEHRGIIATGGGSYADIDCVTEAGAYPCSVNIAGPPAVVANASNGATAYVYGIGDFTGGLRVSGSSSMTLYNSRQVGLGGSSNGIEGGSSLTVDMDPSDVGGPSQILGVSLFRFGRLVISGTSTLAGAVQCYSAADAWFDPTITKGAGASVTGCAHATLP